MTPSHRTESCSKCRGTGEVTDLEDSGSGRACYCNCPAGTDLMVGDMALTPRHSPPRKPYFRPRVKLVTQAIPGPEPGLTHGSRTFLEDFRLSPLYQPLARTKAGGQSWDGWGRPPEGFR